ncbi:hypothetical protein F4677DRAFT_414296 [Hypoxylon crocopeplum]|nr:hypothetical protein F4677DRAFT_414296 [Hypoxylon crocopeplum]
MESSTNDLRTTMENTVKEFLSSPAAAVRAKESSLLSTTLSTDCTRQLKPASFVNTYPFIKAVETNTEHDARMAPALMTMEESRVEIQEIVIDHVRRKASVHAEHWTKIVGCEPNALEICWYMSLTEDGKKISRVVEFIDTAAATRRLQDMMKQGFKIDKDATQGDQLD